MSPIPIIDLPNGDLFPIPPKSTAEQTTEATIITTPDKSVIKVFHDGTTVQMISRPLGMETQTTWTKDGCKRLSWDENGNLRFRVVARQQGLEKVSHETCYQNQKLHHVGLTLLGVNTLLCMHLIKKNGTVGIMTFPKGEEPQTEDIPDFPRHKRLMSIRSIADIEKLDKNRQRE